MIIDFVIIQFVNTLGGYTTLYSLFSLYFLIGTGAVFYKITTI